MKRISTVMAALFALGLSPQSASACGGFFCSSAPIEQAGETLVYGLEEDGTVTMAIQIRYAGDDDDFAWILPVTAPPEISLGTDALFDGLHAATRPIFQTREVVEGTCRSTPRCVTSDCATIYESPGCGASSSSGGGWTGDYVDASPALVQDAAPVADAGVAGGVTIFSRGPIGPYETVVLGATTAREVVDWLLTNGYDVPDSSLPLLEDYATTGHVFVALRLRSNVETRIIRPIVLRIPTTEPCLPIRLTSIATVPGMPITAFFLGRERVTSINYSTATIDTTDGAFYGGARQWNDAVRTEVSRLGGRAFATDYAGRNPALSLTLPEVTDLASVMDPSTYLRELAARGYSGDARLLELLEGYVVPPVGREARSYFNCLFAQTVEECGAPVSFDPIGLTERIDAEITVPRREADELVHRHPYLTRLYTAMNADEMTADPLFITDSGLGDQSNVHLALRVRECDAEHFMEGAPMHWRFEDGETSPISAGRVASDSAYCTERGGIPESECASSSSRAGGCLCTAAGAAPIEGGVILGFLLMVLGRGARQRRSAGRGSKGPAQKCS